MKKSKINFILATMAAIFITCSCSKSVNIDYQKPQLLSPLVDKSKLYGVCDMSFEEYDWRSAEEKIDYHQSHLLMNSLGANSIRFWTQFYYFMDSPTALKDAFKYRELRDMYEDLVNTNPDATIIGMNHSNYLNGNISQGKKPRRDLSQNSTYRQWLLDYEQCWYNLARIFPEINYWEIDNEINNDDFMAPYDGGVAFTLDEKARISADMLFHASRGIHHANKNAKTISGGIIVFAYSQPNEFTELLYDEIARNTWGSTNPDDFFNIYGVHPYINIGNISFTKNIFKDTMNGIYDVIVEREGKPKTIYCTEVGFNDYYYNSTILYAGESTTGNWIKEMYEAAEELGYIESLCYFKMYDNESTGKRYGLFRDPVVLRTYDSVVDGGAESSYIAPSLASPKPGAFKFQTVAEGSGDLYSYSKHIRYHD